MLGKLKKQANGMPVTIGQLIADSLTGKGTPHAGRALGTITALGALAAGAGSAGGALLGSGLSRITSPGKVSINNIYRQELSDTYDQEIQAVRDRIERRVANLG